jgi:hypothetical protein
MVDRFVPNRWGRLISCADGLRSQRTSERLAEEAVPSIRGDAPRVSATDAFCASKPNTSSSLAVHLAVYESQALLRAFVAFFRAARGFFTMRWWPCCSGRMRAASSSAELLMSLPLPKRPHRTCGGL